MTPDTTPAEEAEDAARTVARRAWSDMSYLMRASVWRFRFSPAELQAAEVVLDAVIRELDSLRDLLNQEGSPP